MKNIICILVTYNPDINLLRQTINSILLQVDSLYISDNSTQQVDVSEFLSHEKVIYQKMDGNVGIAAAQNFGIRYAIKENYKYIYFLDQDSISPCHIVENLYHAYLQLKDKDLNVGAVGPRPYNRSENKPYTGLVKRGTQIDNNITEVSELINSATFVSVDLFTKVGLMDENLFIDGVDHEWCWRAFTRTKCRFFIIENELLSHQLGEGDRYFLWRKVAISTPFRIYYQYRNYIILLKRDYVPLYWKLSNGLKYIIKLFYYPCFIAPRTLYMKNIFRGIKDGFTFILKK